MSEKRFIVESVEIFECGEFDKRIVKAITDKNELYTYSDIYEIADLLNEQQATIRKLQDLCGESDSENAKLRIENKQLRKQCFELEKDYLIETSDISDKIYLGDEIKELKQRYGVDDE